MTPIKLEHYGVKEPIDLAGVVLEKLKESRHYV